MKSFFKPGALCALFLGSVAHSRALTLADGVASFTVDMATLAANTPFKQITGIFGISEDYTTLKSGELTPFDAITRTFTLGLNPLGTIEPPNRDGQAGVASIQGTTLDFDAANVLGSWTGGTNMAGVFLSGGEQIGLGGGVRFSGDYTGVLLFGDFALRYSPTQVGTVVNGMTHSGLVLVSNIDFGNAVFADLADATIFSDGSTLSLTGTLLLGGGIAALGAPGAVGVNFGTFSLTADVSAVPEPSACALLLGLLGGGAALARRPRRASS